MVIVYVIWVWTTIIQAYLSTFIVVILLNMAKYTYLTTISVILTIFPEHRFKVVPYQYIATFKFLVHSYCREISIWKHNSFDLGYFYRELIKYLWTKAYTTAAKTKKW